MKRRGNKNDFVITYSLDSYITVQGKVNGGYVNESGYLLTGVTKSGDTYSYRGIEITEESSMLKQYIYEEGANVNLGGTQVTIEADKNNNNSIEDNEKVNVGAINQYPYKKVNGVKYYLGEGDKVFSVINEEKYMQTDMQESDITTNDLGKQYYMEAFEFTNKVLNTWGLYDLSTSHAVDINGNAYSTPQYDSYGKIFEYSNNNGNEINIEDKNSNFNGHRTQVIKNVLETALIPAISSYKDVSTSQVSFAMPKLTEYEWEQIANNITAISFMQGLNIGGKIYSGHSIVTNNNNEEFVSEDSIYMLDTNSNTYYKVKDKIFVNYNNIVGVFSADFQRRKVDAVYTYNEITNGKQAKFTKTIYYYPRWDIASYTSIVNPNTGENEEQSIYEYLVGKYELAKKYYTALGRERKGLYRVHNMIE